MRTTDSATTILLVDDDEDFLFQHRVRLEKAGFRVIAAGSRIQAEEAAATARPDLAVVDLMMEHHDDGFVLSHHLKRAFPGLPIIMVTGVTSETGLVFDPATPAERSWVGADAVLAKPIRFEQLLVEIDRLLAVRQR
jgi:two-component system, OmpR family, KDP operon response regulator KdpE